ncbi:AraC family transcriptional regulator [Paenibacillus sp. P26]|nr:AraC family transcriptional regulator [Paenibacillus sp. P26]
MGRDYFEIHPGGVFVILPGENHAYLDVTDKDIEIINCLFPPESVVPLLPEEPGSLEGLPYIAPFYAGLKSLPKRSQLTSEQSTAILELLEGMIREQSTREPGCETVNRHRLIDLLIRLSRYSLQRDAAPKMPGPPASAHELLIRRVRQHLEAHYPRKITAASLAQEFNISQRHLNRVFKQETGTSITAMLQQIRIERAKHMLLETERSIEAVATAVGFGDASFFTRLFSRLAGHPPGAYRKLAKKNRRIS